MTPRPWAEPELVARGRLPMHAVPHADRLSLDGAWRFQLLRSPEDPVGDDWGQLQVPGAWTMQGTWDKVMCAAPFGRGAVVWEGPLTVPRDADDAAIAALIDDWSARLAAATRRAEALVRA